MYRVCALKLQLRLAALVCIPVISRLLILTKSQKATSIWCSVETSCGLPYRSIGSAAEAICGELPVSHLVGFFPCFSRSESLMNFKLSRPFQTSTIRTLPPVLPWFSKFWNSVIFYKVCRPTSLSDSLMAKLHGTRVD